jgi:Uma2 family endonuclease
MEVITEILEIKRKTQTQTIEIPDYLVYETIDGNPIYYRGFKEVLKKLKTPEEIMGCSSLQGILISCLLKFLYKTIDETKHHLVTNEIGFHLQKKTNLSADIAIYDFDTLKNAPHDHRYLEIPPLVVIEIDTKADTADVANVLNYNYYYKKTQKLFDFGVQEVFWIFTDTQQILCAKPQQDWLTIAWEKEILILQTYHLTLPELIKKDGLLDLESLKRVEA